jgi:hypothetical protein
MDLDEVRRLLRVQHIETPSWAYGGGNSSCKAEGGPTAPSRS